MTNEEKEAIRTQLEVFVAQKGSANKAATFIGVSAGTISQVRNNNWSLIRDDMWRSIAAAIRQDSGESNILKKWNIVETKNYKELTQTFSDAQEDSLVMAVCAEAGSGKSVTAKCYAESHHNVFVLSCSEYWNRKVFLLELLRVLGRNAEGDTVGDMVNYIVQTLKRTDSPLLIVDEADKLSDQVLYFFITLYNKLEDHCGIVLMATDYLQKKITRGIRLNKKGYKEIYSRIGHRFITLSPTNSTDIAEICTANGIDSKTEIKEIEKDSDNDLRRVRRKVFAINKMKGK